MVELRVIKEILSYTQQYRNLIVVIKIGKEVIAQLEKLGIIKDICMLRTAGVNIIVAYDADNTNSDYWINSECTFQDMNLSSVNDIEKYLSLGIVPTIHFPNISNLSNDKAVASLASKLGANKLIYITNREGVFDKSNQNQLLREVSVNDAETLLTKNIVTGGMYKKLEAAITACEQGVDRVHIISGFREGSLLKEIFSCEGVGTMIYSRTMYINIRNAKTRETADIVDILKNSNLTIPVVYADVLSKNKNFHVFTVDDQVQGCVMAKEDKESNTVELAYTATYPPYENSEAIKNLLEHIIQKSISRKMKIIFLEPEKNSIWLGMYPWFTKLGFKKLSSSGLSWHKNRKSANIWVKYLNK